MALTDKLTAVADAIRDKTGKTESMTLDQMPLEIAGIAAGGSSGEAVEWSENEDAIITRTLSNYTNDRIKFIGTNAFAKCTSLTTASLPACASIGAYAFD